MLGKEIHDPHHTESEKGGTEGLGLLEMRTTFSEGKLTDKVESRIFCDRFSELDSDNPIDGKLRE